MWMLRVAATAAARGALRSARRPALMLHGDPHAVAAVAAQFAGWPRSIRMSPGGLRDMLQVPQMGESITEGTLVSWEKTPGQTVAEDDVICQIETDKVTVDVRAPKAGKFVEQLVAEGDTVAVGADIANVDYSADAAAAAAAVATSEHQSSLAQAENEPATSSEPHSAPPPPPPPPSSTPSKPDPKPIQKLDLGASGERRVAMTRMRRRIAERLKEAQNTAAMLTTFNEVDMSSLIDLRSEYKETFLKKHGTKLGFMSAFVKAAATALQEQPEVNAFIDGTDIVYRDYVDVSVAVSTPTGLVVPVIRGCENMTFADVEKTINSLGQRARTSSISLEEMQGGTFTISNGGVFGSLQSMPILNVPQSAILGINAIVDRPVAVDGEVVIRPMMYLALTYDHRLIDGREAVTFLRKIKLLVEDPRKLLLDII